MKIINITFALFVLSSSILFSQNVNIPDVVFKNYLVNNNSLNTDQNSEISYSEAAVYTGGIYLASAGVSDLSGIEAFTNITTLSLKSNQVSSLNLSANTELTWLGCSDNLLTSLDLSQNTKLIRLSSDTNMLTSLDLSNNILLEKLYCSYNSLTSLDLSNNPELEIIHCSNNNITNIYFYQNSPNLLYIDELGCHNNNLSTLNLSVFYNISQILASGNPNLYCIQVNDPVWASTWANGQANDVSSNTLPLIDQLDSWASYSSDCSTVGINNSVKGPTISIQSNGISIFGAAAISIYTISGQNLYNETSLDDTFIVLNPGIYIIRLESEGKTKTEKVFIRR
ncbi:MAG: T9SS type A sorting domain-containing protein [Flavobacteriales bacterium]|nr:T9SS type A sorting domain-containing protein [Flavobacteriales bacterium]